MDSIWRKITHNPERLALSGHIQTEAAVIGGGMAGILTAFFLQEAGVKTIVLEAGHVGEGQTGSTTAKITAQHGLIYDGLIHSQGKEKAALYARANSRAVEDYRSLVKSRNILRAASPVVVETKPINKHPRSAGNSSHESAQESPVLRVSATFLPSEAFDSARPFPPRLHCRAYS